MDTSLENRLIVKIFAGYYLSPEIRRHLHGNKAWKLATIAWQKEKKGIQIIPYHGKKYLGVYLKDKYPTIPQIKEREVKIKRLLLQYCPEINEKSLQLVIFPQVFIQ